jgi:hypothetical protein
MKRLVTLLLIVFATVSFAQYDRPGSTDAQFLNIGVSPRGAALGDSYIALVEGAEGAHYNVANIIRREGVDAAFNHTLWFAGINHDFASISYNAGDVGAFAAHVTALYTDEMEVTTPLQPSGTGETFYAGYYRFGLAYSRWFTNLVSVGVGVSYIYGSLYQDFTADAVAFNVAATYVGDFRGFRFGMQIANFGSNLKYVYEGYPLPTTFTFGAAINALELENQTVKALFKANKPNDGAPLMSGGLEYDFQETFFLRGGYNFSDQVADYSFGGGVNYSLGEYAVSANYSYNNYEILGGAHRFGMVFNLDL